MPDLIVALKNKTYYTLLTKFDSKYVNTITKEFILRSTGGPKVNQELWENYASLVPDVHISEQLRKRLKLKADQKEFGEMAADLKKAQTEIKEKMQEALDGLEKKLAKIKAVNEKNVKNSKDFEELHAALVAKVLVIGSKQSLYAGHDKDLEQWLLKETIPPADPQATGKLKVKKASGLSRGSITAQGGLAAHKAVIAPLVAEFSKKKLL